MNKSLNGFFIIAKGKIGFYYLISTNTNNIPIAIDATKDIPKPIYYSIVTNVIPKQNSPITNTSNTDPSKSNFFFYLDSILFSHKGKHDINDKILIIPSAKNLY